MAIFLYAHNQVAYESVLRTLSETRKACVIHPTGTGKSFVGFKYCEEHPEECICWISPSEYIFRTQCENLAATGAAVQKNIGEKDRLEGLGMVFLEKEESLAMRYRLAERYYREHGDLKIPGKCVMDGVWMDKWISEQRKRYEDGKLVREQIQALDRQKRKYDDGKQSEVHIEKLRQIGFDLETYKPRVRRSWRSNATKSTGAVL